MKIGTNVVKLCMHIEMVWALLLIVIPLQVKK